jgi:DNA polymerase III subunit epsilon
MRFGRGHSPLNEARWVVLDVETSGLDVRHDRLLAIAAIGVAVDWVGKRLSIVPGDSFEVVLRQTLPSSHDNILLHGIGTQRQRDGLDPAHALAAFAGFVGQSPLLAFHSAFDQAMIERHLRLPEARTALAQPLANPWLDIEHLCAVTHERVAARSLDDWMAHFGITCAHRHEAASDTLAECEVLLRIWPRMAAQCNCWRDVQKLAAQLRWIARART